jgi:hypothetical protein
MPDDELLEPVREFRARGRSPKEIARALKVCPAAVTPLIRRLAAADPRRRRCCLSAHEVGFRFMVLDAGDEVGVLSSSSGEDSRNTAFQPDKAGRIICCHQGIISLMIRCCEDYCHP